MIEAVAAAESAARRPVARLGVVNVRTLERTCGTEGFLTGEGYGRLEGMVLSGFDHDSSGGVFGLRAMREDGWRPNSGYNLLSPMGRLRVFGALTIKGVTCHVALAVVPNGRTLEPWGKQRVAFSASANIDRRDFGFTGNLALDTGGIVIGESN